MKKIIILSDASDTRVDLLPYLKELFPECEIQILTYRSNRIEEDMSTEKKRFKESQNEEI